MKIAFILISHAAVLLSACSNLHSTHFDADWFVELNAKNAPLIEEPCGFAFTDLNDICDASDIRSGWADSPEVRNEGTRLRCVTIQLSHLAHFAPEYEDQVRARLANVFDAINKSGERYAIYVRKSSYHYGFYLKSNASIQLDRIFYIDKAGDVFLVSINSMERISCIHAWKIIESGGGALIVVDPAGFFGPYASDVYSSIETLNYCTCNNIKWALGMAKVAKTGQIPH